MSTIIKISELATKPRISGGDFVPIVDNDGAPTTKKVLADAFMPVGTVIHTACTTAPNGFLACDGAAVSRTTYADLFSAIGTTYGAGDGSTTFTLPDLRGLFVRGAGAHGTMTKAAGGAFDGGSVGATSNDQMQGHRHFQGFGSSGGDGARFGRKSGLGSITSYYDYDAGVGSGSMTDAAYTSLPEDDASNGTPRTGNETKPASISLLYCIKY